jgi:hypothetical protein
MYKTGQIAQVSGTYRFIRYVEGTPANTPLPTANERTISLDKGDRFPPINSTNKGAYWQ